MKIFSQQITDIARGHALGAMHSKLVSRQPSGLTAQRLMQFVHNMSNK
jgi:hypothetical protein